MDDLSPTPAAIRKAIGRGVRPGDLVWWSGPRVPFCVNNGRYVHHIVSAASDGVTGAYTADEMYRIAALSDLGADKIIYVDESEWEATPSLALDALLTRWHG